MLVVRLVPKRQLILGCPLSLRILNLSTALDLFSKSDHCATRLISTNRLRPIGFEKCIVARGCYLLLLRFFYDTVNLGYSDQDHTYKSIAITDVIAVLR